MRECVRANKAWFSSQSLRNVSPTTHAPSPPSIGARCFVGLAGYPARAELFAPRLRGVPAGTAALQELCTLLYGKPGCKSGVHAIVFLATFWADMFLILCQIAPDRFVKNCLSLSNCQTLSNSRPTSCQKFVTFWPAVGKVLDILLRSSTVVLG